MPCMLVGLRRCHFVVDNCDQRIVTINLLKNSWDVTEPYHLGYTAVDHTPVDRARVRLRYAPTQRNMMTNLL